jgi:DNA-binding NtrC family response regulator
MADILLIEDDELLRDTLLQMLELDGHRVSQAADGEIGLKGFSNGSGIDQVIADILIPGVEGTEVLAELHRRQPGLPIIASSGGRRVLTHEFSLASASVVMAKPVSRNQLQAAVRQAPKAGQP